MTAAILYNLLVMVGLLLTTLISASLIVLGYQRPLQSSPPSLLPSGHSYTYASITPGDTGDGDLHIWMAYGDAGFGESGGNPTDVMCENIDIYRKYHCDILYWCEVNPFIVLLGSADSP